jgi:predicted dehydrogenase
MMADIGAALGVALVGLRNHGVTVRRAIEASRGCRLAAVCDADPAALAEVEIADGVARAATLEKAMAAPGVEAVAIATPNHLHAAQIDAAARARKHVFVEKPLAATAGEARVCIRAMEEGGLVLLVGHNTRRRRSFRRAKELLEAGAIGAVVGAEAMLSRHVGIEAGLPDWKRRPDARTLIPMTQLGIHFVDAARYLFGPIAGVFCRAWNSAMPDGVPDSSSALLVTAAGPVVSLSSHYVTDEVFHFTIYGTAGTLAVGPASIARRAVGQAAAQEERFEEGLGSFIEEFEEFAGCVRLGRQPETGGAEGLAALLVLEAMLDSVESNALISMEIR